MIIKMKDLTSTSIALPYFGSTPISGYLPPEMFFDFTDPLKVVLLLLKALRTGEMVRLPVLHVIGD